MQRLLWILAPQPYPLKAHRFAAFKKIYGNRIGMWWSVMVRPKFQSPNPIRRTDCTPYSSLLVSSLSQHPLHNSARFSHIHRGHAEHAPDLVSHMTITWADVQDEGSLGGPWEAGGQEESELCFRKYKHLAFLQQSAKHREGNDITRTPCIEGVKF